VQNGVYGIGVDTDQYFTLPEAQSKLLSSALKLLTPGTFELIQKAKAGAFPGGNFSGKGGFAPYHDTAGDVPAAVDAKMQEINRALLDGSLKTNVSPVKPAEAPAAAPAGIPTWAIVLIVVVVVVVVVFFFMRKKK
jgi:basic membrane protein A